MRTFLHSELPVKSTVPCTILPLFGLDRKMGRVHVVFKVGGGNWKTLKAGTGSGNGNGNVLSGRMHMTLMNGRGNLLMAE